MFKELNLNIYIFLIKNKRKENYKRKAIMNYCLDINRTIKQKDCHN